jgi:hypothetical protein
MILDNDFSLRLFVTEEMENEFEQEEQQEELNNGETMHEPSMD